MAATGAAVVLGVIGLLYLPPRFVDTRGLDTEKRLKAENDLRTTLVQALGGTILIVGLYFTSRNLGITREGQITDRFTKAIAQLGDDKLDVRLGGIYALERIARESATDHGPIMEVLTAYLREHARWEPPRTDGMEPTDGLPPMSDVDARPRLRADVQAIATVLGRRPEERRRQETKPLDLREVDLRHADLDGAHLERANLRDAHLDGATLAGAHLEEANLDSTNLEEANLRNAHLEAAVLQGAHLERANLRDAHLEKAKLMDAHLEGARLVDAHLEGATLVAVQLGGADLTRAHLEGARLFRTHLDKANLMDAHLERTLLVHHTDLSEAEGLTRGQLEVAITDPTTVWPAFEGEAFSAGTEPS